MAGFHRFCLSQKLKNNTSKVNKVENGCKE